MSKCKEAFEQHYAIDWNGDARCLEWQAAWNARGKVDAEICRGRIGGSTADDLWWDGFRAAMKQVAKVIEKENEG